MVRLSLRRKASLLLLLAGLGATSVSAFSVPACADEPAASAGAQQSDQELERKAESIARSVMSPFCPGRTVSACPVAGPWRDDIRKWVREGVSAEEIRKRLHDRVPEHNLMGVPPNRLGWALPIGAALLAVAALVFALRYLLKPAAKSSGTSPAGGAAAQASDGAEPKPQVVQKSNEDYDARLEEELETLEPR